MIRYLLSALLIDRNVKQKLISPCQLNNERWPQLDFAGVTIGRLIVCVCDDIRVGTNKSVCCQRKFVNKRSTPELKKSIFFKTATAAGG